MSRLNRRLRPIGLVQVWETIGDILWLAVNR
jgi:hypothetical protein